LDDPPHRAVYAALTAEDPAASMLASLGTTMAYLGYIDQARARLSEALSPAYQLKHAHTLGLVLEFACWQERVAPSPQSARQRADELIALSTERGFLFG
jgi:hypothetical protein